MDESMSTKEAILTVVRDRNIPSMYQMAKELSDEKLKVQPIQISRYLKGSRMSKKVADRFEDVYGIKINDHLGSGVLQLWMQETIKLK